jgi:cytochrome c oxidase assembly factor CtaG
MPHELSRLGRLLLPAGVALSLLMALPPVATYAQHDMVAQALQFVVFAAAAPALLVLGWPWYSAGGRPRQAAPRPAVRVAAALLPLLALVIVWRLPVVVTALARDPLLGALQLVSLVAAGFALWAELAGPRVTRDPLPLPLRAAMAAVAMWAIWAIAYITGMSTTGMAHAQAAVPDHQLAVGVMWAVSAACYVPVVFATMMSWLSGREEPSDVKAGLLADPAWPDAVGPLPPPRGWRPPPL